MPSLVPALLFVLLALAVVGLYRQNQLARVQRRQLGLLEQRLKQVEDMQAKLPAACRSQVKNLLLTKLFLPGQRRWRLHPGVLGLDFQHAPRTCAWLSLSAPKTGTTTLTDTLAGLPSVTDVHSSHHLSAGVVPQLQAQLAHPCHPRIVADHRQTILETAHLRHGLARAGYLLDAPGGADRPPPAAPLHIVTSLRDPVAMTLSTLAWNDYRHDREGPIDRPRFLAMIEHLARLASGPLAPAAELRSYLDLRHWLHFELAVPFGIDAFATPFDQRRGWQIYETRRVRLLLIRQENFGDLPEALGAFARLSPGVVPQLRSNAAIQRESAADYRRDRAEIKLPRTLLERIYAAPFARHFYGKAYAREAIERWAE